MAWCLRRILSAAALFSMVCCEETYCEKQLKVAELIPKYIDEGTKGDLKVSYGGNNSVNCGNELSILATLQAPEVTYDVKGKCRRITLLMFDPDSIGLRRFLHWLVVNIPAAVMKNGYDNQCGRVVEEYFAPGSQLGHHRYTFCVYCQKGCVSRTLKKGIFDRIEFEPRQFAEEQHLGKPLACNFFYSSLIDPKYQDVPVLAEVSNLTKGLGKKDGQII